MDDFIVSGDYLGYVYVGHAQGNSDRERRIDDRTVVTEKMPYFNMYVLQPVSSFQSEDYSAFGYKAEKLKCISADVWADLEIGEQVQLFFDDKKRVQMAASVAALRSSLKGSGKDKPAKE